MVKFIKVKTLTEAENIFQLNKEVDRPEVKYLDLLVDRKTDALDEGSYILVVYVEGRGDLKLK